MQDSGDGYGSAWVQMGLNIELPSGTSDEFGRSVWLNAVGDRVVIGSPYKDNSGYDKGMVKVYDWDGAAWTQVGDPLYGNNENDNFGFDVCMNAAGSVIAVGAIQYDTTASGNEGLVRVFEYDISDPSLWVQKGSDLVGLTSTPAPTEKGFSVDSQLIISFSK